MKPIIAIVGRPNVGKSRLFNRLVGYRQAIVDDAPGVTRDRHYGAGVWNNHEFIVVDTGGIEFDSKLDIEHKITKQSLEAISEADVIICLFDGTLEPNVHDGEVARQINKTGKPVVYAVNKVDVAGHEVAAQSYYKLGIKSFVMCSAEHGRCVDDLLEEVIKYFPKYELKEEKKDSLRIAVAGRPNVGKSTLINRLSGSERVIAHEIPGTTRDAIDVNIEFQGSHYIFVDTAGIRKKFKVDEKVEKFSAIKSLRAIDRSDVICFLIDATDGLTHQDLSLAGYIHGEGKGIILLINKWDLQEADQKDYEEDLKYRLKDLGDINFLKISAKTGYNCLQIFDALKKLDYALNIEIPTPKLNNVIQKALKNHHLPVCRGKAVNILYATQTGKRPATFTLFSNYPAAVPFAYRRYLMNKISEAFNIKGMPIKLVFKRRK